MTDLQASLIGIGAVIVAAVISYNKWQEYKARKTVEQAFSSSHDDVLMQPGAADHGGNQRLEPTMTADTSDEAALAEPATVSTAHVDHADHAPNVAADHAAAPIASMPVDAPARQAAVPAAPPVAAEPRDLAVDDVIDCVVPVALNGPMRGEKLLQSFQSLRHIGSKGIHFIGQETQGEWSALEHGKAYGAVRAGVQLANRSGPLNEIEYSETVMRLRQIADSIDAELDVPDMPMVMNAAKALYQFVNTYDAQLSVNIRSNGAPWAISTLLAALERQGFDLRPDGRLVMPDGEGGTLFSLSTNVTMAAETTPLLTLLLNVPCVAEQRDGFNAMIACARMLAARLGGVIVDDSDQPLSDAAIAEIAGQVATFYSEMQATGIAAGSARALRLFA